MTEVWYNGQDHPTLTFERFVDLTLERDIAYQKPVLREVREYGELQIKVLHPESSAADYDGHLHDMNIVIRAVFGDFKVLLTADPEVIRSSSSSFMPISTSAQTSSR